jgi:hypothetical protein
MRVGEDWFSNAMSVPTDIVFYFVPEYTFGPRLIPVLIGLLILGSILQSSISAENLLG